MKKYKLKKILIISIPFGIILLDMVLFFMIFIPLNSLAKKTQKVYGGNYVESIISCLESDGQNYKEKNHAIWVLGEIPDKSALPVLEQLL